MDEPITAVGVTYRLASNKVVTGTDETWCFINTGVKDVGNKIRCAAYVHNLTKTKPVKVDFSLTTSTTPAVAAALKVEVWSRNNEAGQQDNDRVECQTVPDLAVSNFQLRATGTLASIPGFSRTLGPSPSATETEFLCIFVEYMGGPAEAGSTIVMLSIDFADDGLR